MVILDLGLPSMDGFEIAREIESQAWGKDVALVALTGWGQQEDYRKTTDAGFDAHLVKPVAPE
ncbi:MAG: response regulator, partial [Bryobacteraceae bacterium]